MDMDPEKTDSNESIEKEICYNNGLNYSKLGQEGLSCLNLEMYFTGFPKLVGLDKFPNLKTLCVLGHPIGKIENLIYLTKLIELWIVECNLQEIMGLAHCSNLMKLYLYSNKIYKIENLDNLIYLKVLHLNNNRIEAIQGLEMLVNLKELNLAENFIELIGNSMKGLTNLEILELSGNPLFSLQDVKKLTYLKNLATLSLKGTLYRACPITTLMNYSFFMVYHFWHLKELDEENIDLFNIKLAAEHIVNKKIRYHRMKRQSILVDLFQYMQRIDKAYIDNIKPVLQSIGHLEFGLLEKNSCHQFTSTSALKETSKCYRYIERHRDEMKTLTEECEERAQTQISYLQVELESVGNISIIIGNPNYTWFYPCLKVIQSRFCGSDCPSDSTNDISIAQIARIENTMTSGRFNFYVNSAHRQDESSYWLNRNNVADKSIDYLFCVWTNDMSSEEEIIDILTNGMKGQVCHLSNSIQIANALRASAKRGKLILCKVFLGNSAPYMGISRPTIDKFTNGVDSLYQSKQFRHEKSMGLIKKLSRSSPLFVSLCNCSDLQMHWYIKEPAFVCPEFIVEFEYINNENSSETLEDKIYKYTLPTLENLSQLDEDIEPSTNHNVSNLLKQRADANFLLMNLDLTNEKLGSLKGVGFFRSLIRLVVCHNSIASLEGLTTLTLLEELDVSHNQLRSLQTINVMFALKNLNVNFNQLTNTYQDLLFLKLNTPNLTHLNLSFNPWKKACKMKTTAFQNFLYLEFLDDERNKNSEDSNNNNNNNNNNSKKNENRIYCSCDDDEALKGMDIIGWSCLSCWDEFGDNNVKRLKITNDTIMTLDELTQFSTLTRATLDNNNIVSIEGLRNSLHSIIELSLSNNHLSNISILSLAHRLKILCIDYNNISILPSFVFHSLNHLQILSMANNNITTLESLSCVTSLIEIYASHNNISDLREFFYIKKINFLTIVDFHGNPICKDANNYRFFAIYHLKPMKILDGIFIDSSELAIAKEIFGGILTKDFITDQLNTTNFSYIKTIDLPQFSIQTIDLGDTAVFFSLVSINLEHNNLTSLQGLTQLNNLKTLCMNYNHIEGLFSRVKNRKITNTEMSAVHHGEVLQSLEVLHLGYNGIRDLSALYLNLLPSLRALFLQGNEITLVSGLDGCTCLEELVLDRNRIRFVNESSFNCLTNLIELHVEENRLRSLSNFSCLKHLKRLYLGMNHLQETSELDKLTSLTKLVEVSLTQNNLAKRNTHKLILLHNLPNLQQIDGSPVTDNDRSRAEVYFAEQTQFISISTHCNSSESSNLTATALYKQPKPAMNNNHIEVDQENNTDENFNE